MQGSGPTPESSLVPQPLLTSHSHQTVVQGPLPGFLKLCPLVNNFLELFLASRSEVLLSTSCL